jgi:rSAM/selenodomain-associated transferase 1
MRTRIVIFAKVPLPGQVKTRLIPRLGSHGAARLAQRMLAATLAEARAARLETPELCGTPDPTLPEWKPFLPDSGLRYSDQGAGDLGERLTRAARRVVEGGEAVLLIGSDCPALDHAKLRLAAEALLAHDAVIHRTLDGGYALLGLRRFHPSLFKGIEWSGPRVAEDTIVRIETLGWSVSILETLQDIDVPDDLESAGMLL